MFECLWVSSDAAGLTTGRGLGRPCAGAACCGLSAAPVAGAAPTAADVLPEILPAAVTGTAVPLLTGLRALLAACPAARAAAAPAAPLPPLTFKLGLAPPAAALVLGRALSWPPKAGLPKQKGSRGSLRKSSAN